MTSVDCPVNIPPVKLLHLATVIDNNLNHSTLLNAEDLSQCETVLAYVQDRLTIYKHITNSQRVPAWTCSIQTYNIYVETSVCACAATIHLLLSVTKWPSDPLKCFCFCEHGDIFKLRGLSFVCALWIYNITLYHWMVGLVYHKSKWHLHSSLLEVLNSNNKKR